MANKALNQVSQVQSNELANVKTFLAVMNNGEIKQMSKEDMAAVVGELLSSLKLYPFMFRGIAGDLDSLIESGYYEVRPDQSTNIPPDAYTYGILEVFKTDMFTFQRYTPHSNSSGKYGEFNRVKLGSSWGNWRFIPYQ